MAENLFSTITSRFFFFLSDPSLPFLTNFSTPPCFISLIFPSSSGWMLPSSASHIFSSCELLKAVLGPRQYFFFPALHCGLFPLQPWQTFAINPCFLPLFQLWKIPLLMSRPLQLMTITALFRIPPAGCLSLTPGWDWTQGQSSTTWSNVKPALGGAGGWTSWSPYNLNYCLVPNAAFFPKCSLKRCVRLPEDARSISFPIWISEFHFASQRIHTWKHSWGIRLLSKTVKEISSSN